VRVHLVVVGTDEVQDLPAGEAQQSADVGREERQQVLAQLAGGNAEPVGQLGERQSVGVRRQRLEDPGSRAIRSAYLGALTTHLPQGELVDQLVADLGRADHFDPRAELVEPAPQRRPAGSSNPGNDGSP
jgi:hypothetical protein